jgi:hypothetical protein
MAENTGAAQERELLGALHEHVAEISQKIDKSEYRLIDGLHRRFPETLHASPREHGRPGRAK